MQLSQSTGMRMDQRQLLTPRMIQSMEILQLPLMALEERIEQEIQNNPVLELRENEADPTETPTGEAAEAAEVREQAREDYSEGEQTLELKDNGGTEDDFDRLARISDYFENEEFNTNGSRDFRVGGQFDGERDKKMDAMNNTASRGVSLQEHLLGEWAFVDATPAVRAAGEVIINNIDGDGYLRREGQPLPFEELVKESKTPLTVADFEAALRGVQTLEPTGVGARNLRECLLIQLNALQDGDDADGAEGHDFDLERALVTDHLKDLEMNRYPQIAKRLGRTIDEVKAGVRKLATLHPHPGKLVGGDETPPIIPDAIIWYDEESDQYEIEMTNDPAPNLYISGMWRKFLKEKKGDKQTREFLSNNVRNARWLIESIEQRKSTITRVIRAVVDAQREFFDKGPEFLRPLPMILVADQLGIHVATVSRAVSEKWIQTPRGVFLLRRFFSGGTQSAEGEDMSWDAVKEKLKMIIGEEDKNNPLNDDEIVEKLAGLGIELARRTVAKYRKILNIPTARQRREF
jgi:RNA polymerase sigma-54 factor